MNKFNKEILMPAAHQKMEYDERMEAESNPRILIEKIGRAREKLNKIIMGKGADDFFSGGIGAAGRELSQYIFKEQGRGINNISLSEIEELKKELQIDYYDAVCLLVIGEAWERSQQKPGSRH